MNKVIIVKALVQIPRVPNFLRYDGGTIPVGDVIDDDLRSIGVAWTTALLNRANEQRVDAAQEGED